MRRGFMGLSAGAEKVGAEPDVGSGFCLSWTTRRFDQTSVVRWHRAMFIREAFRERKACLAVSYGRSGFTDVGAVIDAVRRD